jgi:damage-control phosphatase, subfamily I
VQPGMKTTVDCIPCFIRQALEVARLVSRDPESHERIIRRALIAMAGVDMGVTPTVIAQQLHRHLRGLTRVDDPYREVKDQFNRMALDMLPGLRAKVENAPDPLATATRLAIAGNVIDLGAKAGLAEVDARTAVAGAITEPLLGDMEEFRRAVNSAGKILYLADNAGEIVFDRLLIERLPAGRTTLAVRGGAVINDATLPDARKAGLHELAEVIDNGSDAPGTVLDDCSEAFRKCFCEADVIIAKGQGNFETLFGVAAPIFFLLKVKCPVIASHAGLPVGTHVLRRFDTAQEMKKGEYYAGI